jgi:CRISPR/Cas system CSM-associated protein Csm3 (group 7 of RAMP superfamily)
MVKTGRDGIEADMLPLTSGVREGVVPVIPGSSIKGALRSQACRILRTVFGEDTNEAMRMIHDLFGDTEQSGRIFVNDVYAVLAEPPSAEAWFSEEISAMDSVTRHEDHVAIDRFTGGASDGALYSARPVKKEIHWNPIHIIVDSSAKSKAAENLLVELALIELVARDMERGLVPLGFGTNRGMGGIVVEKDARDHFPNEEDLRTAWKNFAAAPNASKSDAERQTGGRRECP